MSDYLGRAVAREMAESSTVRPALPSLFEPGKTSALAANLEPESPVEGELLRNARSETRAENSSSPPAPLAAVNELWADAAATAARLPRPAKMTPAEIGGTPVAASTAELTKPESPSQAPQSQPGKVVVGRTVEAPAEPLLRRALELDAPKLRIARATGKSTTTKSEPPPTVGAVTAPPASVVIPSTSPVPQVVPAPSRSERTGNLRAPRSDSPAPRAIHVTIGRIEVVAVHPPPTPLPQRRAPASPKISLEDYLKQRNGGRQ